MKKKLQHTVWHTKTSLRAKSRSQQLIPKTHSIFYFLFSILLTLFSIPVTAQQYNWDWAVSGGGATGSISKETIYDIKVGTDNNYYIIAPIFGTLATYLDGQPIKTYNVPGGGKDILLFSTDCKGTVRWSHVLGGGSTDHAYNLVLDSNNNVYIGGNFNPGSTTHQKPVYFSPTDSLPLTSTISPSDYWKTLFLVKFSSNGLYLGKKALQGDVGITPNNINYGGLVLDLAIDSQDILHFIVGLQNGTHLDNHVTVPAKYKFDPNIGQITQYHLAKYDSSLNYVSSMVLPISDVSLFPVSTEGTRFAYDETLNRYYLGGFRADQSIPLTYDSSDVMNLSYLLAIDGDNGSLLWHRELYSTPVSNQPNYNRFTSLKVDTNSDVYIGGNLYKSVNEQNLKIYDPNDTSVPSYLFTPGADWTIPMIVKFNSNGIVQWLQATKAYNVSAGTPGPREGKGIAIKNNEVAFGTQGANEFWDNFEVQRPFSHSPDPLLIRFNIQTGSVIDMYDIMGESDKVNQITAVVADKDGNYVTGGFFNGGLFTHSAQGIAPLYSAGESDFFVAKLAAYACGTNSTQKFNTLKINVYPNPTNDIVNIETDETLFNYIIYDVSGRQIQSNLFAGNNQISLQYLTTGTYFIKVTTVQGNSGTVKVVKK